MLFDLTGKTALVTGATGGIGAAIAELLHAQGATVTLSGTRRNVLDEMKVKLGERALVIACDLTKPDEVEKLVPEAERQMESLDILVSNSAHPPGGSATESVSDGEWRALMAHLLDEPFFMLRAALRVMRPARHGKIINITSATGISGLPRYAAYAAARAAVNNLTVSLSVELARTGVTVNTVSPGCTRTAMFEGTLKAMGDANGWPEDLDEREKRFMDLGLFACASERYGRPEEVGALIAFLASPLSAFVNGADYRIDGGQVQSVN